MARFWSVILEDNIGVFDIIWDGQLDRLWSVLNRDIIVVETPKMLETELLISKLIGYEDYEKRTAASRNAETIDKIRERGELQGPKETGSFFNDRVF